MKQTVQKRGHIVRIDVGDNQVCYAVALKHPLFHFFSSVFGADVAPALSLEEPPLFKVCVSDRAVKSGRWLVVSKITLGPVGPLEDVTFFKQDVLSGKLSSLQFLTQQEVQIDYETALRLENAAVWDPELVEARLRMHLSEKPEPLLDFLKPKIMSLQ